MKPVLIKVDPRSLKANPWNSNHLTPEAERKLDASLKRLGYFKPVIARRLASGELEILGGEHRRDSAVRLGLDEIDVYDLGEVDDTRAKEIGLADNARYGADDAAQLASLLQDLNTDDLTHFLPYADADIKAIFASVDIDMDALDASDFDAPIEDSPATEPSRPLKTHTIMRFKVPLADAERIEAEIEKIKKHYGFVGSDALTNAGDALVQLLLGTAVESGDE